MDRALDAADGLNLQLSHTTATPSTTAHVYLLRSKSKTKNGRLASLASIPLVTVSISGLYRAKVG